jgi:hypothetical protein
MQKLIVACNRGQGVDGFKKEFNIKDTIWNLAKVWTDVTAARLKMPGIICGLQECMKNVTKHHQIF